MEAKETKYLKTVNQLCSFINEHGETMDLSEIIRKNFLIKSVMFLCKNKKGEIINITVSDEAGIIIDYVPGNVSLTIFFNDKLQYDSVVDFDEKNLLKREIKHILKNKYVFSIHADNLRSVNWIN